MSDSGRQSPSDGPPVRTPGVNSGGSGPSDGGPLRIVSWNVHGLKSKIPEIVHTILHEDIHIFLIQETNANPRGDRPPIVVPGFQTFFTPQVDASRGLVTLIHRSIPARQLDLSFDLGLSVERLSIEIYLDGKQFYLHNIHRKYRANLFTLTPILKDSNGISSIIMGDFNAHNTRWGPSYKPTTKAGRDLSNEIDDYPYIVLNNKVRTHNQGSALDLAIFPTSLAAQTNFSIHNSFFSDHFAIQVLLYIDKHILPQIFIPRWNLSKADWPKYINKLSEVSQLDVEPFSLGEESRQLIFMFNVAAEYAIPKTKPYKFRRSHWYRDENLIKAKRIVNKAMKHYKKLPNPNNKLILQEASHNLRVTAFQSKNNSWIKWVNQLNDQTRNSFFLKKIKSVKGTPNRPDIHPNPENKANELIDGFAQRTLPTNLPLHTQRDLTNNFRNRQQIINRAIRLDSTSNTPFTIQELDIALIRSRDTAPGEDHISYSMISKSPIEIKTIMLRLFNKSFSLGTLPSKWKHSLLVPIPKPGNNGYRPISLLSCLSKVMEVLILNRPIVLNLCIRTAWVSRKVQVLLMLWRPLSLI